jgi:hypothetical protein
VLVSVDSGAAAHDDDDEADAVSSAVQRQSVDLYLDDGDVTAAAVKGDTETASEANVEADRKRLRRVERARRRVVVLRPIMDTMVRM